MKNPNILPLYIMEFCAGFARGSYLVCIGWTALVVSGSAATVGQIFIVAMLTNIFAAPIVGVIVDRYDRKLLTILAHAGIAGSLVLLGIALAQNAGLSILWFFVAVIFISAFRIMYQSAHDGLIHANVAKETLVRSIARFRGIHLMATAVGTALTGLIIEAASPSMGMYFSASTSVALIGAVLFVKGVIIKSNATGIAGFFADFAVGLRLFKNNKTLRTMTLLAGIALPVGQLSNAILSSFIRDDLGGGSDVFGIVDAAWPVGGMFAAAVLGLRFWNHSSRNLEFILGLLVGFSTILFSYMSSIFALVIVHAAMGFTVWMCHIVIDGRILQNCAADTVGRSKTYVNMMYSFSAMVMCFSPTVVKLPTTSGYFLFWGVLIFLATTLLWASQRRAN